MNLILSILMCIARKDSVARTSGSVRTFMSGVMELYVSLIINLLFLLFTHHCSIQTSLRCTFVLFVFQRAFYFSDDFLISLFKENGYEVEEYGLCCKQVENRSREIIMNR